MEDNEKIGRDRERLAQAHAALPLRVYFDRSDWEYLFNGDFPEEASYLRELANGRRAVFFISFEHVQETNALRDGLRERLEFYRSFPGTVLVEEQSVQRVLHYEASRLAGVNCDSLQLQANPISDSDLDAFFAGRNWTRLLDGAGGLYSVADEYARRAVADAPRESLRILKKVMLALSRRDKEAFLKQIAATGAGPLRTALASMAFGVLSPLYGRVAETGAFGPVGGDIDETFALAVKPYVPRGALRNPEISGTNARKWRQRAREVAPSLYVRAMLFEHLLVDTQTKRPKSNQLDLAHSVYLPLVNVFTCDKRNHQVLTKAARDIGREVRVFRTRQFPQVVNYLKQSMKEG